jgi:N-acetylglucosamine-6-phosphate deacetylase
MPTMLYGGRILTPTEVIEPGTVVVADDGRIAYVGPDDGAPRADGRRMDLRGRIVVPGFIDVHVHGGNGITFGALGRVAADLSAYAGWVAASGVTGFLCSLAAPDAEGLRSMVTEYAAALDAGVEGAEPLGLHLEGPFLNPAKKGAFNPAWLRRPALQEVEACLQAGRGWVRQMTLAPELPGSLQVAAILRDAGVVASMGHTDLDYAGASAALRGNFTHITHAFNAQRGFGHREPGVFGAILASERVTAEMIADTVHSHPGAMKVLLRCLGTDRVVLITDAIAGAGLAEGVYDLLGDRVTVRDGRATLNDGTLAGSVATLNQCVHNVHEHVGVPLAEAVKMGSLNPARAMGFAGRLGSIGVGKDASLAVIDEQVNVYVTLVKGKVVHCAF